MESHAVPFPSEPRFSDERSPERRADDMTPHGRVKSSPTLPDWPLQAMPTGTRPRLSSLDLAVASARPSTPSPSTHSSKFLPAFPSLSPSSHSHTHSPLSSPSRKSSLGYSPRTHGSPQRLSALLTPPLTPSGSFNSASTVATSESEFDAGEMVPSTPSDGGSPLTWGKLRLRKTSGFDLTLRDDGSIGLPGGNGQREKRDGREELSKLMKAVDLTPRHEGRRFVFGEIAEQDARTIASSEADNDAKNATRFLLLHNVPPRTTESALRSALAHFGITSVKGIIRRQPQGTIIIVFYDIRQAMTAVAKLEGKTIKELTRNEVRLSTGGSAIGVCKKSEEKEEGPLRVQFVDKASLEKMFDHPPAHVIAGTESTLLVEAFTQTGGTVTGGEVQQALASQGDLREFRPASRGLRGHSRQGGEHGKEHGRKEPQVFYADYFDSRCAAQAREMFENRTLFHLGIRVYWASEVALAAAAASEDEEEGEGKDREMEEKEKERIEPYPILTCGAAGAVDLGSPPRREVGLPGLMPESPTPTRGGGDELRAGQNGALARLRTHGLEQGSPVAGSPYGAFFFNDVDSAAKFPPQHAESPQESNYAYAHHLFGPSAAPSPTVAYQQAMYHPPPTPLPLVSQLTGYQPYAASPFQTASAFQPGSPFTPTSPFTPASSFGPYASETYGMPASAAARMNDGWYHSAASMADAYPTAQSHDGPSGGHERAGKKHTRSFRDRLDAEPRPQRTAPSFTRLSSRSRSPLDTVDELVFASVADASFPSAAAAASGVSEKNQLNMAHIESGIDTRTTVMIKNIPNKMSDRDLMEFIGKVCPRRIDFLYLRMDFQNGCNVGYAFVNFIKVEDLLHFAKSRLGVKWNMYSSEKILQMSYANYQGKEALVEKFKNSCIMDEREEWRPKIFFSDGPSQGLSEPFPPPTHLRRKERSASNRGALFVPGAHYYAQHGHGQGNGRGQTWHGQGQQAYRQAGYVQRFA